MRRGHLADTNILLRWAHPADPLHPLVTDAVERLRDSRESLFITLQNLVEFWNVSTRPLDRNGFGLSPLRAQQEVVRLEAFFPLVPETPGILREWRQLVVTSGVSGVQVHDARLAAVMRVHGLTHILTLNTADFARYPGITAVHPGDILAA